MRHIQAGDRVAFNRLPDAVWFDVIARDGFVLTVRESGTDYAEQRIDVSAVAVARPANA